MANNTWYGDGTATVAVGSRTVIGTDTGWLTEVAGLTPIKVGDEFGIHVGRPIVIEQIISDTELLLADDWPGPAQTDAPYKIRLTPPSVFILPAMRNLLASLSNGNLDSLSEITVGTDDIPIGIGPGVFGTIKKFELKDGVQFDEWVPNLAGRAAYNGAAKDFAVLVIDIGDGRSAIYFKNSATSGDWSAPSYVTGPVGPAGVNQRGNYSAGTAYAIRDIVQYGGSTWIAKVATTGNAPPTLPTTENTQWLLFARSGTAGVVDRGSYSGAAAYSANDIVLNNGSTWLAHQATTGNAPPVLPTESNAYWRLLARKGIDGTGTGDVVGPASSVDGQFAAADGTTGKSIKFLTAAQARQALGGWELIAQEPLGGVVSWSRTDLGVFRMLRLTAAIENASESGVLFRLSNDNGASYASGSAAYSFATSQRSSGPTTTWNSTTANGASIQGGTFFFSVFEVEVFEFNNSSRFTHFFSKGHRTASGVGQAIFETKSSFDAARAENAIQLINTNGVAMSGFVQIEGVRG